MADTFRHLMGHGLREVLMICHLSGSCRYSRDSYERPKLKPHVLLIVSNLIAKNHANSCSSPRASSDASVSLFSSSPSGSEGLSHLTGLPSQEPEPQVRPFLHPKGQCKWNRATWTKTAQRQLCSANRSNLPNRTH